MRIKRLDPPHLHRGSGKVADHKKPRHPHGGGYADDGALDARLIGGEIRQTEG